MAPKPSLAFVAFAMIRLAGTSKPDDFAGAISASLRAGKSVTRYGRMWRLPKHTRRGGFVYGRIGFEYPESTNLGVWDEAAKDYASIRPAQITPFVVDLDNGRVAFELKSSTIKPWTFQTNFQALLNTDSRYRWRVELEGIPYPTWEKWEKSVNRITSIQVRLERPNPTYKGKHVEDVLENAKATAASLALTGENIDPDASAFVNEVIEHGKEYGHVHARGVAGGEKVEWKSEEDGIDREQAARDPSTKAVPPGRLRQVLEQRNQQRPPN